MKKRSTKSRKEMKSPKFNSVGEYLASVEPTEARILRSVIDLILAKFPELESKIPIGFIPLYIRLPFLWRILGKQFLLVARRGLTMRCSEPRTVLTSR